MAPSSESQFRIIGAVVAVALAVLIVRLRFCYEPSLPPKPPKPRVDLEAAGKVAQASEEVFANYLKNDAIAAGVDAPTVEDMSRRFPHRADETGWRLHPGDDPIEVAGLRIRALVRRPEAGRHPIMALSVENSTDEHLAYRIESEPTRGTRRCSRREAIPYNALTLEPGQKVVRGECVYRRGWGVRIGAVETVSLPPLGYFYVSKIPPEVTGLEPRLGRDHRAPERNMCQMAVPTTLISSLERGRTAWRDVIDFYARHRCETYMFPMGYKAFPEDGARDLPALSE